MILWTGRGHLVVWFWVTCVMASFFLNLRSLVGPNDTVVEILLTSFLVAGARPKFTDADSLFQISLKRWPLILLGFALIAFMKIHTRL